MRFRAPAFTALNFTIEHGRLGQPSLPVGRLEAKSSDAKKDLVSDRALLIHSSNAEEALGSRCAVSTGIGCCPCHEIRAGFEDNIYRASCVGRNNDGTGGDCCGGGDVVFDSVSYNCVLKITIILQYCWPANVYGEL